MQSEAHGAGETRNRFFVALIKTWRGWDLPVSVRANPEPILFRVSNKNMARLGFTCTRPGKPGTNPFPGLK